uniref:Zinc finger GRF-type domain-containing protein n=1 Tax=Oryza punctata TaxID=4537 RepID=A0A0E0M0N6_ORYPU
MDGGYTASASSRRMGMLELPLIQCLECELKIIVRRKAKTPENNGHIFYTCPSHQRDGTGCDFWY